jgi:hypothetical protein
METSLNLSKSCTLKTRQNAKLQSEIAHVNEPYFFRARFAVVDVVGQQPRGLRLPAQRGPALFPPEVCGAIAIKLSFLVANLRDKIS